MLRLIASPMLLGKAAQQSVGRGKAAHRRRSSSRLSGGAVTCRNFRQLLWYWEEYYLRRGRDRLSIEFSSHIPFRHWMELVGKQIDRLGMAE